MTEPIRVKDLSGYDFIRYLELSGPDDLDIFGSDSEAELRIDPYGLPPTTVRSKETQDQPNFPKNPRVGEVFYDKKTYKSYLYSNFTNTWKHICGP